MGDMEKITFLSQASTDSSAYLPRICRSNLALPESIMLEDCRYCRRQLAHAAGRLELLARHLEHMLNNDCSGGSAMRQALLAKARTAELKNGVLYPCSSASFY